MRQKKFLIVGALSLFLLALLMGAAVFQDSRQAAEAVAASLPETAAELVFDSEELIFEGQGSLDLMEGVYAADEDGADITDQVNAVLTGAGSKNRKKIRYTVFTSSGRELSRERTLVLENYRGPEITVPSHLELDADDLGDLVPYLREQGLLRGEDGFGLDITGQITWTREKITKGLYRITFRLDNAYLDSASAEAEAVITGKVQDIRISLYETETEIPKDAAFEPLDYLEEAVDPVYGDISGRVEVSGLLDTHTPGAYRLVYTAVSVDGTQVARANLKVTVR